MQDRVAQLRQAALDYKAALEEVAHVYDGLASSLILMADELDRQGLSETADMFEQASHHHRAGSIRSRAIAASLKIAD